MLERPNSGVWVNWASNAAKLKLLKSIEFGGHIQPIEEGLGAPLSGIAAGSRVNGLWLVTILELLTASWFGLIKMSLLLFAVFWVFFILTLFRFTICLRGVKFWISKLSAAFSVPRKVLVFMYESFMTSFSLGTKSSNAVWNLNLLLFTNCSSWWVAGSDLPIVGEDDCTITDFRLPEIFLESVRWLIVTLLLSGSKVCVRNMFVSL